MKPTKPKNTGKIIKRLMSYVTSGYRVQLIAVLICILISALAGVAGSVFIKSLIDSYIAPLLLETNPVYTGLLRAVFVMAAIYLLGVTATFLYNRTMVTIAQGVLKKVRDDMFSHMQNLSISYFDTHPFGDVMSRYTNDADTLRQLIAQGLPQMFSSVVTVVAVFFTMLSMSPILTMLVLICVVLMVFVTRKVGAKSSGFFKRQQKALGDVNGYIEESINGQKVVKVFCHEEEIKKEFARQNAELRGYVASANTFGNILGPISGNLGHLQYVLIALVGGALAIGGVGGLTLGTIAAFLTLSRNFSMPISQLSQQLNSVLTALAGAQRIFGLMDEQAETDEGYVSLVNAEYINGELTEAAERTGIWAWRHPHAAEGTVTYEKLAGDLRFFDVDFGYVKDKPVLHDVTLYAKPGQKIAFVGATGAGKTTITNLINRFYNIEDGKIRFDGININKIKKSDLRKSLGMVLQDTSLFTGTVMENIRFGRLDATDEDVIRAAKLANAHEFIMRLTDGYATMISGDGGQLSQGQRQLITIARAAVADPPVMILDEATSSIDTRTEAIVQKGMDSLMEGRTVFVIAHRLSTVQNSKAIMVMEHGRIIERGDHESLIAEKGRYYQLYTGVAAKG